MNRPEEAQSVVVTIPVPPSLNNIFKNARRGRIKVDSYDAWIERAGWELKAQRPKKTAGKVDIAILVERQRGDIDNRAKATIDLLAKCDVIDNDRNVENVSIGWSDCVVGAEVVITPFLKARAS